MSVCSHRHEVNNRKQKKIKWAYVLCCRICQENLSQRRDFGKQLHHRCTQLKVFWACMGVIVLG